MVRPVILLAFVVAACAKDPPPPPAAPGAREAPAGLPPASQADRLAPPAAAGPAAPTPHGEGLPPGHVPVGSRAAPPGHGVAPPAVAAGGPELSGEISVAPALAAEVKRGDVVYLVARSVEGGEVQRQALAIDRLEIGDLPMRFKLTAANVMVADKGFTGAVQITARVDRDGEAMTRQAGDLEGKAQATIPQSDVKIVLDTKVAP